MATHRGDEVFEGEIRSVEPLLRWTRVDTAGADVAFLATEHVGSCVGADQQVYLCALHSSLTVVWRSLDHGATWEATNPTVDDLVITDISGEVDVKTGKRSTLFQLCSADGKVYYSSDAGDTWSNAVALPSTTVWHRIRKLYETGLVVVVGFNKIATSNNTMDFPISFTSQTVPGAWSARTPGRLFQAPPGSSGHGMVMTANDGGDTRRICYTLDVANGTTWVETGVHATSDGGVVWITWSEHNNAWYCITKIGKVYRAATLDATWVKVADLYMHSGTDYYYWIEAAGPLFVIHGSRIGQSLTAPKSGNFMVTDFRKYTVFQESDTVWSQGVLHHDHQLLAFTTVGVGSPFGISTMRSGRAPWIL